MRRRRVGVVLLAVVAAVSAHGLSSGAFTGSTQTSGVLSAAPDWVAPAVNASVIAKAAGGEPGYVRSVFGGYRVYANVTDSGNPSSGITSVTADVRTITTGGSATVPLVAGSYQLFGKTYTHRSEQLTAWPIFTTASYSVAVADGAGNSRTAGGYSVTADNTAPAASDVQATNGANTAGRPDTGDKVTYTFSEPVDPSSVLPGWTGEQLNVVVRIVNNDVSNDDTLRVYDATNSTHANLGPLALGRNDYVSSTTTFGPTGTPSTIVRDGSTIVVTLGSPNTAASTRTGNARMVWNPSTPSPMTDRAGNGVPTTSVQEGGSNDANF